MLGDDVPGPGELPMVRSNPMRWSALATMIGTGGLLFAPLAADACEAAWREPLRAAVLRLAHYPTEAALRAYLDLSSVPRHAEIIEATLDVHRSGTTEAVATLAVDARAAARPGGLHALLHLPELKTGPWRLRARFATRSCPEISGPTADFEVARFGWEGNRLGLDAGVIPPFTPLSVEGNRIGAVLREHTLSAAGLFSQIVAAGRPLLAEPMRFVIVANGEPQRIQTGPVQIRPLSPERVSVAADLNAGPLTLRLEGELEIDGLYRIRLRVVGDPGVRVDRLDLVVPLEPEHAGLMNAITDETRIHHLGRVPEGAGTVWKSADAPRRQIDAGFVPYLWVGDEERGLAWLAESTRDYWFTPGDTLSELRRRAGRFELVVHFASTPGPLARPRELEFALQATPVKPRPAHAGSWRLWQLACDAGSDFVGVCPLPAGSYWGTASHYGHLTPRDGDETVFRWMVEARNGRSTTPPIDAWLDRHSEGSVDRATAIASLQYSMRVLSLPSAAAVVYMNAQGTAFGPEFATYVDEWRAAPFGDRAGGDEPREPELPTIPRASNRDRLLWHLDRVLASKAADGVFFDNTFLRASFDDLIGTAYRDESGRLHPGVEIYALRELLRRSQALVWKHRGGWWNVAHLTTTPISAIHGFVGISLDGEWNYGENDYPERFSRELLRAAGLGSQLGTVPVWLPGLPSAPGPRRDELVRQLFGLTALHEIRVMEPLGSALGDGWRMLRAQGYGEASCEIGHYWDAQPLVRVGGVDASALTIRCGDRITALVVGFDEGGMAELRATPATGRWRCRDLERRWERVASNASGCDVRLGRFDVRLIEMRSQ